MTTDRPLTDYEKFLLGALYRMPGMTWETWRTEAHVRSIEGAQARDKLVADGIVRIIRKPVANIRGAWRQLATYETDVDNHPWLRVYEAWVNGGQKPDNHPMPDRRTGFFAKGPSSPQDDEIKLPPGKAASARGRVLEMFLRNLGQPWNKLRLRCKLDLRLADITKNELVSDKILRVVMDYHRDRFDRPQPRAILLPDEGHYEVKAVRKQYGLKRPHTPPARRAFITLAILDDKVDLTVPLSLAKHIPDEDDDGQPIIVPPPAPPPEPTKLAEIATQERETPAPIKAQAPFKPLTLDIPTVPRSGGLLANLDINALIAEQETRALPREEDDWKVAAMREQEAETRMREEARALQVTPDVIRIAVADTHDIDPAVEAVDETPEQEALGFTAWTFPDSE